jgi:hypothetical protein
MQFGSMPIQLFGRGCCRVFHSWLRAIALQQQKTRAEGVSYLGTGTICRCHVDRGAMAGRMRRLRPGHDNATQHAGCSTQDAPWMMDARRA